MLKDKVAKSTRAIIKAGTGLDVQSVAWIDRSDDLEFAQIVVRNAYDRTRAEEFLTDPRCPFVVSRQTATRIFIAAVAK